MLSILHIKSFHILHDATGRAQTWPNIRGGCLDWASANPIIIHPPITIMSEWSLMLIWHSKHVDPGTL